MRALLLLAALLVASPVYAQTNPCDSDAQGPFIVTTGRAFTAQWCTSVNQVDPSTNTTVPTTIDGFYISLDGAARQDIGKPTSLGLSSTTNRNAWQMSIPGVQKGNHTFQVIAYNFVRDPNTGQPTSERQESAATLVPFSAVDPVFNLAPPAPTGGRIIR